MAGQVKPLPVDPVVAARDDFPGLRQTMNGKRLAYLDSASSAQKPQAVIDAISAAYSAGYANIHRGLYAFSQDRTQAFEDGRRKVARFINAKSDREIVFTRNATEAINLVAASWGRRLQAGDEVILSGMEHHANLVPWHLLRQDRGITLKFVPVLDDGQLDMATYETLLSPRTRLIACTHVSNALGTINDVARITRIAKTFDSDITVLIDGAQSVVHDHVNVQAIGCDFLSFTGHKLYGPTGLGVLWGRYDLLDSMPPYQGGGDMIDTVSFEGVSFKPPPARFEAGTPAIAQVIGLGAAIDYVSALGMDAIATHEKMLLDYAMDGLRDIPGLSFHGTAPDKAGIISFTVDWAHPSDIAMILDKTGVAVRSGHHCCQPLMQRFGLDATLRASIALYTDKDDIDQLVAGIAKAKEILS